MATTTDKKLTDAETAGLKGSVRQVKETIYNARKNKAGVILARQDVNKYQTQNRLTTYDETGRMTEDINFGSSGAMNKSSFNEKGQIVGQLSHYAGGVHAYRVVMQYDNNGNQILSEAFDADGKPMWRTVQLFDDKNHMLESNTYNYHTGEEKISNSNVYTHDENGNMIDSKCMDADGAITFWRTQKYNHKNHVIEMVDLNADGSVKQTIDFRYLYDANDNPIPNNTAQNEAESKLHTYEYEYDEKGNWIQKIYLFKNRVTNLYVREFSYFDDAEIKILQPISPKTINMEENNKNEKEQKEVNERPPIIFDKDEVNLLTTEQAQWIAEGSPTVDNFSAQRYFVAKNNEFPSTISINKHLMDPIALLQLLQLNMEAEIIHSYSSYYQNSDERLVKYTLAFPNNGYLLQAPAISQLNADEYDTPNFSYPEKYNQYGESVFSGGLILLHPSNASGKRDFDFEDELEEYINECTFDKIPEKPTINMIQVNNAGFTMVEYPVNDDFEIKDLDLNYGRGFQKFHDELMGRFQRESKGLVLFHGEPGTGKTFYIRHLLRKMATNNKVVIYMPPNMVDHLVEPAFMTFISNQVADYSANGNFCVLLIEDAEPLLAARQSETRIQGVTNLLNMTDGLLNDMLNLQIICTFNVHLKKLDKALLRPGRLLARKEFKPLPPLDANILAQRLGIKYHFDSSASLSEIYAMVSNKSTLIHDVNDSED